MCLLFINNVPSLHGFNHLDNEPGFVRKLVWFAVLVVVWVLSVGLLVKVMQLAAPLFGGIPVSWNESAVDRLNHLPTQLYPAIHMKWSSLSIPPN